MSEERFRIGVAGLGFGAAVHVPAFQSIPGVEVAVLAGSSHDRARERAARLGVEFACGGFPGLFEYDIDAVSLALPPRLNAQASRLAFERKIAVLSEKPTAGDVKEAGELARLANGKPAMVDFQFAESRAFKLLNALLMEQRLGAVRHVVVSWLVNSYAHQKKIFKWKLDRDQGGGVLAMLGQHFFFLTEWLFGPIRGLSARLDCRATAGLCPPEASPAEDLVHIRADLHGGAVLQAVIGNASPGGCGHRMEITCERGTIILHNPTTSYVRGFSLILRHEDGREEQVPLPADEHTQGDERIMLFRSLALRFVAAVRNNQSVKPDFGTAARVQSLITATVASARERAYLPVSD